MDSEDAHLQGWKYSSVLKEAFAEQVVCIKSVYAHAQEVGATSQGTHSRYRVSVGAVPDAAYSFRKNVFSVFFQTAYHLLHLESDRRLLYGKLIHLFRMWVTSADNLLDGEDKIVLPFAMADNSRIMKQVLTLMTADRILARVLEEARSAGQITAEQVRLLSDGTLQVLLPSAALEASEEGGILVRPAPDEVLKTIHSLKTGLLFNVAFLGPDVVERDLDRAVLDRMKSAYHQFGVGCQILDDIRDMATDFCEKRHNYILSTLYWEHPRLAQQLEASGVTPADRLLFLKYPSVSLTAARRAVGMLKDSLVELSSLGLDVKPKEAADMAWSMVTLLDLRELNHA